MCCWLTRLIKKKLKEKKEVDFKDGTRKTEIAKRQELCNGYR
jgi:hypothetical protein